MLNRILISALLAALSFGAAAQKVSDLTAASALGGTELFPCVQTTTKKCTAAQIKTFTSASPTLVTPNLGTPSAGVATNLTGTASGLTAGTASAVAVGGITGLGTGVATALAVNTGSAGAPVLLGNNTFPSGTILRLPDGFVIGHASTNSARLALGGVTATAITMGVSSGSKHDHEFGNSYIRTASSSSIGWSATNDATGTTDAMFTRAATGSINVSDGVNGKALGIKMLTELTTIAAAPTTTTTIQKPANSIILGVSVRNTVALPITSTYTVGDSTSADRFSTAAVSKAVNTTDRGTKAGAYYNATAEGIIITPDTTPSDATGRVRVTIHYIDVTPPTS